MSTETRSETIFREYCLLRGYRLERIPKSKGVTPDYFLITSSARIVAEVKEATFNDEDLRMQREMNEQRHTSFGADRVGKRAKKLIKRAAHQLKRYADEGLPMVIVVFDARESWMSNLIGCLEIEHVEAAMYGDLEVNLRMQNDSGKIVGRNYSLGGGRDFRPLEKSYVSAVCVLYQPAENFEPFLVTYHNFYTTRPLPLDVFNGPKDFHKKKPKDPVLCPGEWQTVEISRQP